MSDKLETYTPPRADDTIDVDELSVHVALRQLKVKSVKLLVGWCAAIVAASFSAGFGVARFFEDHETALTEARLESIQVERDTLGKENVELRKTANAQAVSRVDALPCRVDIESIKWEDDKFALRLCMQIDGEEICLPKSQLTFDNVPADYSSSFWIPCQDSYSYQLTWALFSRADFSMVGGGDNSSSIFHTVRHGDTVRTARPYFPQIVFSIHSLR